MRCAICKQPCQNRKVFSVPKNEVRRRRWNEGCGMDFKYPARICEKHFSSYDFINAPGTSKTAKVRLQPGAIPSVNAAYPEFEKCFVMSDDTSQSLNLHKRPATVSIRYAPHSDVNRSEFPSPPKYKVSTADGSTQTDNGHLEANCLIENMQLKRQVRALQKEVAALKAEHSSSDSISNRMSSFLTEGQLRKLRNPNKLVAWSWNDIFNAICLQAAGPRAYMYLYNKGFPLPSPNTLVRWEKKINMEEGIQKFSIDCMKNVTELSREDKICVLSLDDLALSSATTDHHNKSQNQARELVNYVKVGMVRGLNSAWSQPVYYWFDSNMTKQTIVDLIKVLDDAGYIVVALVTNMRNCNRFLWKELDVSTEKPWFANPTNLDEKIFVFADVPHLMKLLRKHFIETGLIWKGQCLTTDALEEALKLVASSEISVANKITIDHISANYSGTFKIKYSIELFSQTTANVLRHCYSAGKGTKVFSDTADLIQLVNDWFDIFSTNMCTTDVALKEPYGTKLEQQNEILNRMNAFMAIPIIIKRNKLTPFQKGIVISNTSLRLLHEYVKEKYNMSSIMTCRLNLEVLDNFFNAIRNNGPDNPTALEFRYGFRKYISGLYNDDGVRIPQQ